MYAITFGNDDLTVDKYLDNYSVNIIERYATDTSFVSISGKSMNKYLGDRRELSVNFEPMETSQINELFKVIKKYKNDIPIKYSDPQLGYITRNFSCNNLPAATYFRSDDGRKFWTIPTVVFSETDESASASDVDDDDERWLYNIYVGSTRYTEDEISNNVSISISAGSSGFSVGQCCSSSISGSLLYKGGELAVKKNTILTLYCYKQKGKHGIIETVGQYKWFIKSFNVQNKAIINFSAVDAVAFTDNEYPMEGTVDSHFRSAENTITQLCGTTVKITTPAYPQKQIYNYSGWTIRTLINYASVYGDCNYAALKNLENSEDDDIKIFIIDRNSMLKVERDNYSALSVGIMGPTINQIRVCQTQMDDPYLEEGLTYDDFGIYYLADTFNNKSNVLNLVCPWADSDIKYIGSLRNEIGKSYGTEFSCDNVKVDEFYPPYTRVYFVGFEGDDYTFYISNANYKLTTIGIFASISGDTKSLSDFEYIGKTETELKTKVALQMGYQSGFITLEDGIHWDDETAEVINSG